MESFETPTAVRSASRFLRPDLDLANPHPLAAGGRVRVTRGPLTGLTGVLVELDVSACWLMQADYAEGVFVRAAADAVELF